MKISKQEYNKSAVEHPTTTGLQTKAYQRAAKKNCEAVAQIYSESSDDGSYIEAFQGEDEDNLMDSQTYQQFLMTADFSNLAQSVKTQTQEEMANLNAVSKALAESQTKG